jgi:uncharacterized protein (DUF849 family)
MTQPTIITAAITGALPRKAQTPAMPVTPSEQIELTHEAYEAGAALAHPRAQQGRKPSVRSGVVCSGPGWSEKTLPRQVVSDAAS